MAYQKPIPDADEPRKNATAGGLEALLQAETAMQVALALPCSVAIGWGLGAWADIHFHQSWIAIAGIVFGSVAGLVYIIRIAISAMNGHGPLKIDGDGRKGPGSNAS